MTLPVALSICDWNFYTFPRLPSAHIYGCLLCFEAWWVNQDIPGYPVQDHIKDLTFWDIFCELTEGQRLMDVCSVSSTTCVWHPGEITGLPSAKSWARAGLELQWWWCGICSYFCIEDLLFQWCHFVCNYNYFPENQGPRLLFYDVMKLISHNKSCLCLVCSGLHLVC